MVSAVTSQLLIVSQENPTYISYIRPVIARIFAELATMLSLTGVCLPFFSDESLKKRVIRDALSSASLNLKLHFILESLLKMKHLSRVACGLNFSVNVLPFFTLIHEMGHFIAAKLLFEGMPSIHLTSFIDGETIYSKRTLTHLGQKIGTRCSIGLIASAGPILELLATSIGLLAALALRQSYAMTSNYLLWATGLNFLKCASYAYAALSASPSDLDQDYVHLQKFGLSPVIATISIIALPILLISII